MTKSNSINNGFLLALASTAFFAAQFPLISIGLRTLDPVTGSLIECLFTFAFSFLCLQLTNEKDILEFNRNTVYAGILNALGLICLFTSLLIINPATVGLFGRLYFVFSLIISQSIFGERFDKYDYYAILFLIFGFFLLSVGEIKNDFGPLLGIGLACLYPLFFAIQNAIIAKELKKESPLKILFKTKLVCLPLLVLLWFLLKSNISSQAIIFGGVPIALGALLSTFFGLWLLYRAYQKTTFKTVSLAKTFEPVFICAFSFLIAPIDFSFETLAGLALILVAIPISSLARQYLRRKAESSGVVV